MDLIKLNQVLTDLNQPKFRFSQIKKSYYSGRYASFNDLTDISIDLRSKLNSELKYLSLECIDKKIDGQTQKALLRLNDNHKIESVLMSYDDWLTVCVSTQIGCPLACKFCATGKMGLKRNLTPEEIIDQIIFWNSQIYPKYVGRIVFMGMGEPFLNWENLLESLKIINSKEGLNIGARKISISTAGVAPKIKEFADLNTQINLAVSLHSADQKIREMIMPIARQYSLSELKNACNYYTKTTNRQIFFEYALMDNINDRPQDLKLITEFIKSNKLFYLNVIPLNQVDGGMIPSKKENFQKFISSLEDNYINFSVRRSFGQKVHAACGQLAANS